MRSIPLAAAAGRRSTADGTGRGVMAGGLVLVVAAFLALLLGTEPARALETGEPMTAEEFEAYVTGRTLTFGINGQPYGIEQYLPGRRVIWAFIGEECREGSWFAMGPQICFEYDDEPGRLHCWTFFAGPDGLIARSEGVGVNELVEVQQTDAPMYCPGPDVGV